MKLILALAIFLGRIYLGFVVLSWIVKEVLYPESHTISEIEVYLVILLFDTWVTCSQSNIDIELQKNKDN